MAIIRNILAFAVLLCLAGCSDDNRYTGNRTSVNDTATYIRLQISVPALARATPSGGENGDGLEPGIRHENEIQDLTLYFYHDENGEGVNAPATTTIIHKEYIADANLSVNAGNDTEYSTVYRLNGFKPREGDRVIVVANTGNLPAISTLGELRTHIVEKTFQAADAIPDYTRFVMSTAGHATDEGKIFFNPYTGKKESPFRTTITLERAAARIDLWYNNGQNAISATELAYTVLSNGKSAKEPVATVHVTNVLPVNIMQQPSYMLKHVTAGNDFNNLSVCGTEKTDTDGMPANYVAEPHTLSKNADISSTSEILSAWYGETAAQNIRENYQTLFGQSNELSKYLSDGQPQPYTQDGYDFDTYVTIAYANENTQHESLHDSRFITGLVFKAIYEPHTVYTDAGATVKDNADYSAGKTFWRYTPTRQEMSEDNAIYFNNGEAAEGYRANHLSDLAEIQQFTGGICYYNLWLRHANADSDPHETFPMEYGIVRNNIYRVGISFTGPGNLNPELTEHDNVRMRIFVRKWNFRLQPQISF